MKHECKFSIKKFRENWTNLMWSDEKSVIPSRVISNVLFQKSLQKRQLVVIQAEMKRYILVPSFWKVRLNWNLKYLTKMASKMEFEMSTTVGIWIMETSCINWSNRLIVCYHQMVIWAVCNFVRHSDAFWIADYYRVMRPLCLDES